MKRLLYNYIHFIVAIILVALIISFPGCKKQDNIPEAKDSGCITRLIPKASDQKVSGALLDSIYTLFTANNLPVAGLQFQDWSTANVVNPSGYSGYQEQVTAIQFLNGLPVFSDNKFFTFNAAIYQSGGEYDGYTGPAPDTDTASQQTLANLRYAFLMHVSESYTAGGPANVLPHTPSASDYTNACLTATLGYLDKGMIKGNAYTLNSSLKKVWAVTPAAGAFGTYYPLVYVEDDNGFAWGQAFLVP